MFKKRADNNIMISDEVMVLSINYHLMCSTDFVKEEGYSLIGKSMIVTTMLILITRIGGLMKQSSSSCCLSLKRRFIRMKNKLHQKRLANDKKMIAWRKALAGFDEVDAPSPIDH